MLTAGLTSLSMHHRHITLPTLFAALLFMGAGCFGPAAPTLRDVSLTYWSTDADATAMAETIAEYRKIRPNVDITLTVLRRDDYEHQLLEALAENRGPDLLTIPNTWMRGWQTKLLPMPASISLPTRVVNDQQQIVTVNRQTTLPSKGAVIRDYVETVPKDVYHFVTTDKTTTEHLYGLPLSLDTPALFYNASLLRSANITEPPKTWRELQEQSMRLTSKTAEGALNQSGTALGLAANVLHYTDILASLMMQNGAQMTNEATGRASFHATTAATERNAYPPGIEALIFYQSFAEPLAANYSWDAAQPVSLDAFVTGKTAFFIGFPRDVAAIRERAPGLDFKVAPLPLIDEARKITVAHYPVEAVSAKTTHPNEAWDFLLFMTQPEQASRYLTAAKRPTALRALITEQLSNEDIAPFAGQVLTARSWYRGRDYPTVENIFASMILRKPTERQPTYVPILTEAAAAVDRTR